MTSGHVEDMPWDIKLDKKGRLSMRKKADRSTWSPSRQMLTRIVESKIFEAFIASLIVANLILMVIEADAQVECGAHHSGISGPPMIVQDPNKALLIMYIVEAIVKIYVYRIEYMCSAWNNLDLLIVVTGCVELSMSSGNDLVPSMQVLRTLRILRLLRAVRLLALFPELKDMFQGFVCAMKAMFWGVMMILLMLGVWALLSVEIVNSRSKPEDFSEQCGRDFSTVIKATLFFFQLIIAGEGWSDCISPLMHAHPEYFLLFGSGLAAMQLGIMTLILTVIVQQVADARQADNETLLQQKKEYDQECFNRFRDIIEELDQDSSGTVTKEELKKGFETQTEMQNILALLDIDSEDMDRFFDLMDCDNSGDISYKEFIDCLRKAHQQDMRTTLFGLKLQVSQIPGNFQSQVKSTVQSIQCSVKKTVPEQIEQELHRELASGRNVVLSGLHQLEDRLEKMSEDLHGKTNKLTQNTELLEAALKRFELYVEGPTQTTETRADRPLKEQALGECSRSSATNRTHSPHVLRLADYIRRHSSPGTADFVQVRGPRREPARDSAA